MVNSLTAVSLPCFSFPCSMCPSRKILGCFQTVFSLAFGFINKIMDQFVGLGLVWFGFCGGFFVWVFWVLIYYCFVLLTVILCWGISVAYFVPIGIYFAAYFVPIVKGQYFLVFAMQF